VGRITAYAGTGMTAQSTDLGWDNLGRVVSLRQPLADDAIAAGVVGGLTASDPRATTSISYDTQGRVTSITAPSGLVPGPAQTPDQQARPRQTFGYDPFTVRADHVITPTGWIRRDVISPSTMLETASFDAMNRETTTTWNVATSAAVRELDVASGLATATTYNKEGLPVSQTGPTSAPASPAAPHTSIDYDTDYSKSVTGTPLTGLSTFYFRGTSFNDTALALHQTGPLLNSSVPSSTPANLAFRWAANPGRFRPLERPAYRQLLRPGVRDVQLHHPQRPEALGRRAVLRRDLHAPPGPGNGRPGAHRRGRPERGRRGQRDGDGARPGGRPGADPGRHPRLRPAELRDDPGRARTG